MERKNIKQLEYEEEMPDDSSEREAWLPIEELKDSTLRIYEDGELTKELDMKVSGVDITLRDQTGDIVAMNRFSSKVRDIEPEGITLPGEYIGMEAEIEPETRQN